MGYAENKARSVILTVGTSMADQSGAEQTDINIIVKKMAQTGTMPVSAKEPIYADFSAIPNNLRDMLEMSNQIEKHRSELPRELQHMSTAELLTTPPQRLQEILTETNRYETRRNMLPENMRHLPRDVVLSLTDEQITNILPKPVIPPGGDKS